MADGERITLQVAGGEQRSFEGVEEAGEVLFGALEKQLGLKETDEDVAVRSRVEGAADRELRAFVERVERLEEDKREIAGEISEVYAEAKGRGYNAKVLRQVVALRRRKAADVAEEQAVLDLYRAALGME